MSRRKIGGHPLESRRVKTKSLLGEKVTLSINHRELNNPIVLEGVLAKKGQDGPYILLGTEAQIPLSYSRINLSERSIEVNLSSCFNAGYFIYRYQREVGELH